MNWVNSNWHTKPHVLGHENNSMDRKLKKTMSPIKKNIELKND